MEHKSTSIELLKFIGQNARMGTITLSELDKHLPEGDMKRTVRKQLDEYEKVVSASDAKLAKAGEDPAGAGLAGVAANAMLKASSLADSSPSHIAEMIIIGSTRGVIELTRHLRDCMDSDIDAADLGYRLLSIEQNNIDDMKHYL